MSIPVKLPIKDIYIGDDYNFFLEDFINSSTQEPINLSSFQGIEMDFRENDEYGPVIVQLSVANGKITISGDDNNNLKVEMTSEDTKKFREGDYIFDMQFIYADGKIETWFKDTVKAEQEVTL